MPKKREHIFQVSDLVRSVLRQTPVTALCGFEATFTRERLNKTKRHPGCVKCFAEIAQQDPDSYELGVRRDGWESLLERLWLSEHPAKLSGYTCTATTYTGTWSFPLAA